VVSAACVALTACDGQRGATDAATRAAADSAEQVMYHASMIVTANGQRRGSVTGDTVSTYEALTRFRFRRMEMQFTTTLGRPLALLTAPGGEYSLPKGTVRTTGPVTIASDTSGRRMQATAVSFDAATNQLTSDSAFTATAGSRKLSGVGFTADPGLFSVKCLKQCTGSLR
jgi:LPS export ABC transporter protein LptC